MMRSVLAPSTTCLLHLSPLAGSSGPGESRGAAAPLVGVPAIRTFFHIKDVDAEEKPGQDVAMLVSGRERTNFITRVLAI